MSSSSSNTTYLITGASRGIGKGLVASYLLRPKTTVIAAVRDPASAGSKSLDELPKSEDSQIIIVKIDSASESDAATAVKDLQSTHNIHTLDVVIANAGFGVAYDTVANARTVDLQAVISVNAVGPIVLFQAVLPLLQQSSRPMFIVVSSNAGSIGGMRGISNFTVATYGASKAIINFIVRKIHFENEGLIAFPIHPGFVKTDMGNAASAHFGSSEPPVTVKDSVDGLIKVFDEATRENTSGRFMQYDGTELPW